MEKKDASKFTPKDNTEQNIKSVELFLKLQELIQVYGQHITARDVVGILEGIKFNLLYDYEKKSDKQSSKAKPTERLGGYS